ncbi:DUF2024 family protein [Aureisphaera galaxeae]|uniref:DUF2024 family protein n=1 Tax=Aureisphaera galaxeae TaxID=1538023 RepID=UPI002350DEC7|nr:DUF2024 family protein [Aureisphaera galaxeae]MDC8006118.1 DUF2024 family protein [Aureisphaera galaxeae]
MRVAVWDTYVTRNDGRVMHFDILVPHEVTDEHTVFEYGMDYLKRKSVSSQKLSTKECRFCHMEEALPAIAHEIESKGYDIIEMENCD